MKGVMLFLTLLCSSCKTGTTWEGAPGELTCSKSGDSSSAYLCVGYGRSWVCIDTESALLARHMVCASNASSGRVEDPDR